jgi:HEAT repeat protein
MAEQNDKDVDPGPPAMDEDAIESDPHPGKPDTILDERTAHFIELLSDDEEISRWKAAEALGRIRDPVAVEELIGTLWDDDARVRLKAAWALGQIGDQRAYAPLQRLYRMENEWAQEIIKEALENIRREMSRQ